MSSNRLYRVVFHNHGSVYEMYAKDVTQDSLYGFVEVSELVFGEHTQLLVDPAEEKLKSEFEGVSKFHVPMHSVIRIDEVEKTGISKITDAKGSNVTPFPVTPPRPNA